jgi:AcrR family transcriptional regulator
MPAVVDHAERRRKVARLAARLLAADGPQGLSVRAIARAAHVSTAIVSHYFHDKRELLLATYHQAMEDTIALARHRRDRGDSLERCLEAIMPLDRRRRDNWKVWFALWGAAMGDAEFVAQQRRRGREARQLFAELIASEAGVAEAAQRDAEARRLLVFVSGLATQATYDPEDWPPARQRALLAAELAALGLREAETARPRYCRS